MAKATTTITFADGEQVTSAKLNQIMSGFSLGSDSVDGTTVTQSSGVLSVGVLSAANHGALSIPTSALQLLSVGNAQLGLLAVGTGNVQLLAITDALIANTTITFGKMATAALAVQADMQSETASKLAAAATLKYHPGVSKAGAVLTMADGSYAGAYNISGTATGSSTSRTVTIPTMANANYRVQFTPEDSGTIANAPVITAKTTTTFTVASGSTKIAFDIFGQLA